MPCGVRVDVSHVMLCYHVFAYISLRLYTPASTCGVSGNRVSPRVWGKWCRFERVGVKVIASKAAVLVTGPKQGAASADPALLHLYPPPFRSRPSQAPLRSLPVHAVPDLLQPLFNLHLFHPSDHPLAPYQKLPAIYATLSVNQVVSTTQPSCPQIAPLSARSIRPSRVCRPRRLIKK